MQDTGFSSFSSPGDFLENRAHSVMGLEMRVCARRPAPLAKIAFTKVASRPFASRESQSCARRALHLLFSLFVSPAGAAN